MRDLKTNTMREWLDYNKGIASWEIYTKIKELLFDINYEGLSVDEGYKRFNTMRKRKLLKDVVEKY